MDTQLSHAQMEIFGVNSYHNSNGITDEQTLQAKEKKNKGQETIILEFFRTRCMESFTADQVFNILSPEHSNCKLKPSVQRAITNLTKNEWLIVVGEKVPGPYGDPVRKWQYSGKPSLNQTL